MLSFFHSSTTCWGIIVSDYGLITTVAAAATFAALVLLIWIMHRTLSPRSKRPNRPLPSTEKKRKKRKGHMRHHHCRNGSGTGAGSANSSDITQIKTPDGTSCISSDKPLESPPSPNRLDAVTPIPPCPPPSILEGYPLALSSTMESPSSPQMPALDSSLLATTTATIPRGDSSSLVTNDEDLVHPLWASDERSRSRVHSVSTVDTSTMSDDQSCGSTSVRSSPSMSVTSSTLGSAEKGRASKSKDTNSRDGSINGSVTNNSKSGNPNSRRQQHKRGGVKSASKLERNKHNNQATADVPMVASSRWDALKPSAKHDHPNSSNHYNHNTHRFNGRGGGRGSRKGRSPTGARDGVVANGANPSAGSESFFSLGPSPAVPNTTTLLTETHNLNRPVAQSAPVVSRSPSPNNTMTALPLMSTMPASNHYTPTTFPPPPPPGLGPLPVVGGGGARLAVASSFSPTNSSLYGSHGLDLSPTMNLNWDWQNGAFSSLNTEMPFSAMDSILNTHRQAQIQHVTGTATPNWMGCRDLQESGASTKDQRQPILAPSGFSGPQYSPLKENPFAPDDDSQIEADLQELGGRMAGSILDF
jgi:hypothetical protein